jgi:ribosomal protein S18 acetylase RimI-like enzyme
MTENIRFIHVHDLTTAVRTSQLAAEIWHQHYDEIIGIQQVDYMISSFQSAQAIMRDVLEKKYDYYLISDEVNNLLGYYAVCMDTGENSLFLSKLYIHESARGRGLSRKMLDHMLKKNKPDSVWLTVNKNNYKSIEVYEHFGFITERMQKVDIGNGFFMDDRVMRLTLQP